MLREVLKDGKRRHREDLLLTHQPHRLVAELVGMIDGSNSCLRCEQRARLDGVVQKRLSQCGDGNLELGVVRLFGGDLLQPEPRLDQRPAERIGEMASGETDEKLPVLR